MPEPVKIQKAFKSRVGAEHRLIWCENCGARTIKSVCPECGGRGRLVFRSVPIFPPSPPTCIKPRCLWHFFWEVIFSGLLGKYHHERCEYAKRNKNKKIPEHYRTGKNSPMTIRDAIIEIIKLKLRR